MLHGLQSGCKERFQRIMVSSYFPRGSTMTRKGESSLPFLLSRIGLAISVPVLPISDAVHCNRPRSALQPPLQCTASVLASTCFSTESVFLLSHIWTVYGRFGMFPASLKYMRSPPRGILNDSESTFEIQMVSYFFESEVKCQNRKRGKTSEDLFDLIQ